MLLPILVSTKELPFHLLSPNAHYDFVGQVISCVQRMMLTELSRLTQGRA